jgi:hypothetical protein
MGTEYLRAQMYPTVMSPKIGDTVAVVDIFGVDEHAWFKVVDEDCILHGEMIMSFVRRM